MMEKKADSSLGILSGIQMVMEEIGAIGKDKRNSVQGFNFRGIDDVMNTLHPLLAKAKLFIQPKVLEIQREERKNAKGTTLIYTLVKVEYSFVSTVDFSNIEVTVYGEGMDSGDKSLNKAMSIALKYACFQLFCIPTEEMVDPDRDSYEVQSKPQYPPEFLQACRVKVGTSTLGKLYKDNRAVFDSLIKTGTPEERNACRIINEYMEGR